MRKHFFILLLAATFSTAINAQTRGIRIGYIDMEYILEKVPDYAEAKNQLELKAQKWKQEAEVKRNEINKLKENLKTERVLLTKELIEEREEEISFLENELLEFQQKRFGSTGDLITQKAVLVKPIQDQVFTIVQDIAEAKKYDFIFDKSSDLTMLFGAQRHNISDQVVRQLTRAEKREQLSKKQLKDEAEKERKQDMIDANPELAERQKVLEDKKAAREKMIEDRKLAAEEKRKAFEEKRAQLLAEREEKRNAAKTKTEDTKKEEKPAAEKKTTSTENVTEEGKGKTEEKAGQTAEEKRAAMEQAKKEAAEERQRKLDERKKALEEKRKKLVEEREAAKREKEEKKNSEEKQ
ncbi:OmpH family outer membrane protein [Flavobacterium lindanitolerans]|jgi:Skp family chaperone for outer membrane proteins|uniref:OmpH family outer membrane protein n=2 Tax=Flavobacterium lindanitolerans TaxID=428988 RepID=UPI0028090CCC|nr:OmpH family outer membrane protein [Flavobacterium lindanitolerans]MDQ7960324.1 OmpH family outer membrane protein [Flavobacterium lindanitolerans]